MLCFGTARLSFGTFWLSFGTFWLSFGPPCYRMGRGIASQNVVASQLRYHAMKRSWFYGEPASKLGIGVA